jgi:hypothetical protein
MFRGVLVFGGVATTHVSAAQAQAQVDPTVARLQALFATLGFWLHALDLIKVLAVFSHDYLPRNYMVD